MKARREFIKKRARESSLVRLWLDRVGKSRGALCWPSTVQADNSITDVIPDNCIDNETFNLAITLQKKDAINEIGYINGTIRVPFTNVKNYNGNLVSFPFNASTINIQASIPFGQFTIYIKDVSDNIYKAPTTINSYLKFTFLPLQVESSQPFIPILNLSTRVILSNILFENVNTKQDILLVENINANPDPNEIIFNSISLSSGNWILKFKDPFKREYLSQSSLSVTKPQVSSLSLSSVFAYDNFNLAITLDTSVNITGVSLILNSQLGTIHNIYNYILNSNIITCSNLKLPSGQYYCHIFLQNGETISSTLFLNVFSRFTSILPSLVTPNISNVISATFDYAQTVSSGYIQSGTSIIGLLNPIVSDKTVTFDASSITVGGDYILYLTDEFSQSIPADTSKKITVSAPTITSFTPTSSTGEDETSITINMDKVCNITAVKLGLNTLTGTFPTLSNTITVKSAELLKGDYTLTVVADNVSIEASTLFTAEGIALSSIVPNIGISKVIGMTSASLSSTATVTEAKFIDYTDSLKTYTLTGLPIKSTSISLEYGELPIGIYNIEFKTKAGNTYTYTNVFSTSGTFSILSFTPASINGELLNDITINLSRSVVIKSARFISTDTNFTYGPISLTGVFPTSGSATIILKSQYMRASTYKLEVTSAEDLTATSSAYVTTLTSSITSFTPTTAYSYSPSSVVLLMGAATTIKSALLKLANSPFTAYGITVVESTAGTTFNLKYEDLPVNIYKLEVTLGSGTVLVSTQSLSTFNSYSIDSYSSTSMTGEEVADLTINFNRKIKISKVQFINTIIPTQKYEITVSSPTFDNSLKVKTPIMLKGTYTLNTISTEESILVSAVTQYTTTSVTISSFTKTSGNTNGTITITLSSYATVKSGKLGTFSFSNLPLSGTSIACNYAAVPVGSYYVSLTLESGNIITSTAKYDIVIIYYTPTDLMFVNAKTSATFNYAMTIKSVNFTSADCVVYNKTKSDINSSLAHNFGRYEAAFKVTVKDYSTFDTRNSIYMFFTSNGLSTFLSNNKVTIASTNLGTRDGYTFSDILVPYGDSNYANQKLYDYIFDFNRGVVYEYGSGSFSYLSYISLQYLGLPAFNNGDTICIRESKDNYVEMKIGSSNYYHIPFISTWFSGSTSTNRYITWGYGSYDAKTVNCTIDAVSP